jgi:hypothetical protein
VALPALASDALHVLVFGPGVGELVLVRAPPGVWMVIDGCSAGGVAYGRQVLSDYAAWPAIVLFTHPHLDHARGVAHVIDDATQGPPESWPVLGMLPLCANLIDHQNDGDDPAADLANGDTEGAIATIADRWERYPPCRWEVAFGDQRPLGEATVSVLSPHAYVHDQAARKLAEGRNINWNTVSTALLVEWRGRRVVLGADLVEKPLQGWRRAHLAWGHLEHHHGMKVPHHGSVGALSHRIHRGQVPGIIAPFACSSRLPSFETGGGVDRLQQAGVEVLLTSLPREYALQAAQPLILRRSDLEAEPALRFDPRTPGYPNCYVAASFVEGNESPRLQFGPGSVRVLA